MMAAVSSDLVDAIDDALVASDAELGELIPALAFVLGDVLGQITEGKPDDDVIKSTCSLVVAAYMFHCGFATTDSANITIQ